MRRALLTLAVTIGMGVVASSTAVAGGAPAERDDRGRPAVRFATFNASLNRPTAGLLRTRLEAAVAGTVDPQIQNVLNIIEAADADVLLINEFDTGTDGDSTTVELFAELAGYPHSFTAPSNTGVASGFDLDNNGTVGVGNDAFGFGDFPGQFGLIVLSRYPIETSQVRTFQTFRWADMPGALLPVAPSGQPWYSPQELAVLRLSSKSHWDVPIDLGRGRDVHFLVSHPTPPVFDGPEDRNGRRNFDEIRFWADYITPGPTSRYIYDDAGRRGGLGGGERFVIAGDQNSDPLDGDSVPGAIQQLLDHRRVNTSVTPSSPGAVEAAALQGGANATHESDPRFDTADFADTAPGNLRADYVLPSRNLRIDDAAVFWPVLADKPESDWTGVFPFPSSDHRLVWVDIGHR
ncbi:MAG TPA: endonuclease/exonuclease/phosphatase family protein [Ilumatobacteraceae bacterium]|nr:endonuclease/exonuclease/phosphatase family protein [Ilumatobacteraceae bacterium]